MTWGAPVLPAGQNRSSRAWGSMALTLTLLGAMLSQPGVSHAAQAAVCAIPKAASGTSAASSDLPATPASVIQVEGDEQAQATPASLPVATPLAAQTSPDQKQETLTTALTEVSESLAACLSAGDAETVAELAGTRFLGQLYGSSVPLSAEEYIATAAGLRPIPTKVVSITDVTEVSEDQATAIVTEVVAHQLLRSERTFQRVARAGGKGWQVASEQRLPVEAPGQAAEISVQLSDLQFELEPGTAKGPDVILLGANSATQDHEMLVLKLQEGFSTADLLRASGPDLPQEATFIGEMAVRSGHEQEMVLVDLAPGEYTLVCLFPDNEGTPHLALGMEATFTIS